MRASPNLSLSHSPPRYAVPVESNNEILAITAHDTDALFNPPNFRMIQAETAYVLPAFTRPATRLCANSKIANCIAHRAENTDRANPNICKDAMIRVEGVSKMACSNPFLRIIPVAVRPREPQELLRCISTAAHSATCAAIATAICVITAPESDHLRAKKT